MTQEKHEFAIYISYLSTSADQLIVGDKYTIIDETIYHRIVHILRLKIGDVCIFFNRNHNIQCKIVEFKGKKQVCGIILHKKNNKQLSPKITILLPMLKRDNFEEALYALAAVGVTTIQCIETNKTSINKWAAKDADRFQRIIISAAEQSKHFNFPELKPPISLDIALSAQKGEKIFFDAEGEPLIKIAHKLSQNTMQECTILVGPEGDLTHAEKDMVKQAGFTFYALTPTILRSTHALFLGAGIVRSLFSSSFD